MDTQIFSLVSIVINEDGGEYDDFEATSKYDDDGVLMYYEWKYDGEPIIILELEGQFFYENWEVLLIGAQVLGVVALIIVIVKKINRERYKYNFFLVFS